MMKKIIGLAGAGLVLLSVAGPAFAYPHFYFPSSKDIAIIKNNDVTAYANTGYNSQSNIADVKRGGGVDVSGGGTRFIKTGNADANALGVIVANTHVGCGYHFMPRHKDVAVVKGNDVTAMADSGMNGQDNYAKVRMGGGVNVSGGGPRTIRTGEASAVARGFTVVNTHVSFGGWR